MRETKPESASTAPMSAKHHVSIIDILFAVAIGAGFTVGFYDLRHDIATLAILRDESLGQAFARLVLAYALITISWFAYRASLDATSDYPWREFLTDLFIYYTYLMLFSFIEHAPAFYATLAGVWALYGVSLMASGKADRRTGLHRLVFFALFALLFLSALLRPGWEWPRLAGAAGLVILYRTLPNFRPRGE